MVGIKIYQTGTPSREVQETIDWNKGASSTEVSRVWANEGAKRLLELKNRRFDDQRWGGLMLDPQPSATNTTTVQLTLPDEATFVRLRVELP